MSVQVPLIDSAGVSAALPPDQCIRAMHDVLRALDDGAAVQPLRNVIRLPDGAGSLYTMPAFTSAPRALVVKLITIFDGNHGGALPSHQGVVVVFDPDTGRPLYLLDAARLTAIRTASVSACATAALAKASATTLAILGTGVQARSHAEIIPTVRSIHTIRIWGRSRERAERLADEIRGLPASAPVEVCTEARRAVEGADVICTTTSAREPVLQGDWLSAGAHVNAIGSSTPSAREVDTHAVARSRIFVDSVEAARAEAGDLIMAERDAATHPAQWTGLGSLLNGRAGGRRTEDEITLFKSVGLAVEDAAAAAIVVRSISGGDP